MSDAPKNVQKQLARNENLECERGVQQMQMSCAEACVPEVGRYVQVCSKM